MPISRRRSPFQIRNNEFSFGVRHRWALLGNKSGTALEVLGLFRFENSELKEVFRDVTWAYKQIRRRREQLQHGNDDRFRTV